MKQPVCRQRAIRYLHFLVCKSMKVSSEVTVKHTVSSYNMTRRPLISKRLLVDCVRNVMAHAQKPDFVFRQNGRVHLNRRGRQFSLLLAGEPYTSAYRVCTARASLCSVVMWRSLVTHSSLLFPLHFSSRASPCAITFQTQSNFKSFTSNANCEFVGWSDMA
jgi:hypothetical protein